MKPNLRKRHEAAASSQQAAGNSQFGQAKYDALDALEYARLRGTASASMVNRTHRVVRQRAVTLRERRTKLRSLYIPLSVCAGLFAAVVFAVWSVLDQYELSVDAIPDSSQQMMVLMMWCLPLSLIVLAVVWLTRSGSKADGSQR